MDQRSPTEGRRHNNGHQLGEEAGEQLDELRARFGELNHRFVSFIRQRPGAAILIALGAGYLLGRILRS